MEIQIIKDYKQLPLSEPVLALTKINSVELGYFAQDCLFHANTLSWNPADILGFVPLKEVYFEFNKIFEEYYK